MDEVRHEQGEPATDHLHSLNSALASCLAGRTKIEVLEAGGGSKTHLVFSPDKQVTFTTIDIAREPLENNTYAEHKILGDICTYRFPPESFDVIVCYDVLEHVDDPRAALASFISAVKKGGCIVIGAPNPLSLKGLVTKFTPYLVHVAFYRTVLNNPNAGKPGYFPYPTTMKFFISPHNIANECRRAQLEVVYLRLYESHLRRTLRSKAAILGAVLDTTVRFLSLASLRRYAPELSDFHLIARKPA